MTRNASVLSDFVFPALLMGCGCLGLVVINLIGLQGSGAAARQPKAPSAGEARSQPKAAQPRLNPAAGRELPRVSVSAPTRSRPRVAALRRPTVALRLTVGFLGQSVELSAEEKGRLSRFIRVGARGQRSVTVQGHGADRSSRKRARRRVRRVVRALKTLGVAADRITVPAVTSVHQSGSVDVVTVVIGQP